MRIVIKLSWKFEFQVPIVVLSYSIFCAISIYKQVEVKETVNLKEKQTT